MISLLIPTMNRSEFLGRLLQYYADTKFRGKILIGDSSNAAHLAKTKLIISANRKNLDIDHFEYPGLNNAQCISLMLRSVDTPYSAFIADDDFLVPNALEKCVEFLDRHPDYSAVHGEGISVQLDKSGAWGAPNLASEYGQAQVFGDTAVERVNEYERNPLSTLFCVHRTETWREMYKDVTSIQDIAIGTEILPCYLSVVLGKVKAIDGLHVIRQLHDQQYIYRSDPIVWITSPEWQPSFRDFCSSVSAAIARRDSISIESARKFIEEHYRLRLLRTLSDSFLRHRPEDFKSRITKRIAGVRRRLFQRGGAINLKRLMNKNSPYYEDFLPIHRAFTIRPEGV